MTASATSTTQPPADRNETRQARGARARARAIVKGHFGVTPRTLVGRAGGLTNFVFEFRVEAAAYVIRVNPDSATIQKFLKQQWSMQAAQRAGVPVPAVLEVGNDADGHAYMIVAKAAGLPGQDAPARMRLSLVRQLGELAAKLHRVRTHGHGPVFDWSGNALSRRTSWAEYLERDFRVEHRLAQLAKLRLVAPAALRWLRREVAAMQGWTARPVLQHRDLRLKNVVADPLSGRVVALLDWDECMSAPPPCPELATALHDLWLDEREAFLEGYGLTPGAYARLAPSVRTLNALQYATVGEHAAKKGERRRLEWIRRRLHGDLDLHP